jgi:putative ATPase
MPPPLAERLRPRSLDTFVGQKHLIGENAVLRQAILHNNLPSCILWGPPGVGKTTLAGIIAEQLKRPFHALSAINSGVKDIRETIEKARRQQFFDSGSPVLFIDEIHRFSKSQQDALLGAVEKGIVTLIGATTENPSFEVIPALLSRCQVYILESLSKDDLVSLVDTAIKTDDYLSKKTINVYSYAALLRISGGDARKLLNSLEIVVNGLSPTDDDELVIEDEAVTQIIQQNLASYDKGGEQHYDIASAFIKSIRGSDPNATVYYLARMIEGGEDPRFICRRMVIAASEDIGLANPNALLMATNCFQAVHQVGMPESRIIMSQTAIYLALCPKSNATYKAIAVAQQLVRETGNLPVPLHLRNAPTKLMKDIGYGADYQYSHDNSSKLHEQEFLPDQIKATKLYEPGSSSAEQRYREMISKIWKGKYD